MNKKVKLGKLFFVSLIALMLFGFVGCRQAENTAVASVSLNKTEVTLNIEDTTILKATVNPSNAVNQDITWTSADDGIATVSEMGEVKAISKGTTTITVTTKDGNKKAICKVTVTDPNDVSLSVLKIDGNDVKLDASNLANLEVEGDHTSIIVNMLPTNKGASIVPTFYNAERKSKLVSYNTFSAMPITLELKQGINTLYLMVTSANQEVTRNISINIKCGEVPAVDPRVKLTQFTFKYTDGSAKVSKDLSSLIDNTVILIPVKLYNPNTITIKFTKPNDSYFNDGQLNGEFYSLGGTSASTTHEFTISKDILNAGKNMLSFKVKRSDAEHTYQIEFEVEKE